MCLQAADPESQQPADKGVSSADEAALAEHGDTNSAEKVQYKANNQFAMLLQTDVSFQGCMLVQLIAVHQNLQKQPRSVNIAVEQLRKQYTASHLEVLSYQSMDCTAASLSLVMLYKEA